MDCAESHRGAHGLAGQFVPRLVETVLKKGPEHVPSQPLKMVDSLAQDPASRLHDVTLNVAQCAWTKTISVQAGLKEENAGVTPLICWQIAREAVECVLMVIGEPGTDGPRVQGAVEEDSRKGPERAPTQSQREVAGLAQGPASRCEAVK